MNAKHKDIAFLEEMNERVEKACDGDHAARSAAPVAMTPIDALRNLVNAIGGGKKACGHQFDCSCAFNDARALLAKSAPAPSAAPGPVAEQPAGQAMCSHCGGEGVIHTGVCESPTTQCRKCDGTGLAAPHSPAAQMGGYAKLMTRMEIMQEHKALVDSGDYDMFAFARRIEEITLRKFASHPSNAAVQDALAEIRDLFPAPPSGDELEPLWTSAMGCPDDVPAYVAAQIDRIKAAAVPQVVQAPSDDAIAKSKRILALVDEYHDKPTADTRTALRVALFDEFERSAPAAIDVRDAQKPYAWIVRGIILRDEKPFLCFEEDMAGLFDASEYDGKKTHEVFPIYRSAPDAIDVRDAALHMQPVGKLMSQLWHHQGGSSEIGQPIRRLFGMGQHEPMSFEQIELAKAWEASLQSPPQTEKEGS